MLYLVCKAINNCIEKGFSKMVNVVHGIKSAFQFQINFNANLIRCLSQFSLIYVRA